MVLSVRTSPELLSMSEAMKLGPERLLVGMLGPHVQDIQLPYQAFFGKWGCCRPVTHKRDLSRPHAAVEPTIKLLLGNSLVLGTFSSHGHSKMGDHLSSGHVWRGQGRRDSGTPEGPAVAGRL